MIKRKIGEQAHVNKWAYSVVIGVVALSFAEEPGGISGALGFTIGFIATFAAISLVEFIASSSTRDKVQHGDD